LNVIEPGFLAQRDGTLHAGVDLARVEHRAERCGIDAEAREEADGLGLELWPARTWTQRSVGGVE
jgi:hypothetical protein